MELGLAGEQNWRGGGGVGVWNLEGSQFLQTR